MNSLCPDICLKYEWIWKEYQWRLDTIFRKGSSDNNCVGFASTRSWASGETALLLGLITFKLGENITVMHQVEIIHNSLFTINLNPVIIHCENMNYSEIPQYEFPFLQRKNVTKVRNKSAISDSCKNIFWQRISDEMMYSIGTKFCKHFSFMDVNNIATFQDNANELSNLSYYPVGASRG